MLLPATYYHIYNHTNGDDNLFREEKNYPFFLEKYHQHIDPIADTLAWCLMPNHFHLLVRIKDKEALRRLAFQDLQKFKTLEGLLDSGNDVKLAHLLPKQFSNFFSSYSQAFNKVYKRRCSLFIKNFRRKVIDNDLYLSRIVLYIHLNPVKHGFTKKKKNGIGLVF
jgi:REP element-mobilizing transposase RayT